MKSNIDLTKKSSEPYVVTDRKSIKAKLSNRGKPCNWLGYAKSHLEGTYMIINPKTNRVILSRDVVFTGDKETSPQSTDEEPPELVDNYNSDDDSLDSYTDIQCFFFDAPKVTPTYHQVRTRRMMVRIMSLSQSILDTNLMTSLKMKSIWTKTQ